MENRFGNHHWLKLDDIGDAARGLFDDTVEDFASLAPLKKHFETWKWLHRGAYNQVNIALYYIIMSYFVTI